MKKMRKGILEINLFGDYDDEGNFIPEDTGAIQKNGGKKNKKSWRWKNEN